MKYLGAHIDVDGPLQTIPGMAGALGATAFAFCPVDARRWSEPAYREEDIEIFRAECTRCGFSAAQILPHASLLLNLCSPDARKLKLSRISLVDQLKRCSSLGLTMLNFHPGATIKAMEEADALVLVAESINYALERTEGVKAVIENTAGQGSNVGYTFGQIGDIISRVTDRSRVGVCIDTCHASAAGYDMSTEESYHKTWEEFDRLIGREYLAGMHINDAMRPTGSRIDRHASIGRGTLGSDFFRLLMTDSRTDDIPLILETPDPSVWTEEIDWLRSNIK